VFFFEHLLNKDGEGLVEVFKGEKLRQMIDKFITLFSPNIQNLVASFKHQSWNKRYISSIFVFKANNGYDYVQDNFFLKQ
jgi:hypothetical protein